MPNYAVPPEIYDQSIPQAVSTRAVMDAFLHKQPLQGCELIIDACCGTGKLAGYLGKKLTTGRVIGLDHAENMLAFAEKTYGCDKVTFQQSDLTCFNPDYKNKADLLICAWAVPHIAADKQNAFTNNLFTYLKLDGKLIVVFPPLLDDLPLATSMREVTTSAEWAPYFQQLTGRRTNFTNDEYNHLLMNAGFINTTINTSRETFYFKNNAELRCFIISAASRYLAALENVTLRDKFIDEIVSRYRHKVEINQDGIPYSLSILSAIATRPCINTHANRAAFAYSGKS